MTPSGHGATLSLDRLSLNQATAELTPTIELLRACAANDLPTAGLWRHKYIDGSARRTRAAADDLGVAVSSLCRGGFFTGTRSEAEAAEDNRRALDDAATLNAPVLVLVCGPLIARDLAAAETAILHGVERLLPHAADAGVTLAIEPFHPMFLAERSAIVTMAQANRILAELPDPRLGVAVDTYHVWWDPDLAGQLAAAAGRVAAVHVADWLVPTSSLLRGRGLPGDGVIPLAHILDLLAAVRFTGHVEVEVLNEDVWTREIDDLADDVRRRMSVLLSAPTVTAP